MRTFKLLGAAFTLFFLLQLQSHAQSLSEELKILGPLVNKTWVGELKSPDGSQAWQTTHTYTPLWDGTIVKLTENTPERDASSEGYFYWDREEQKIAVLVVNKKGIYKKGFVTEEDGILTINGKISFPERTFDFKNTFEFTADGKMIDRWFQNAFGSWMAGHIIEFTEKDNN